MNRVLRLWIAAVLVVVGGVWAFGEAGDDGFPSLVASVDELVRFASSSPLVPSELYVILLPGNTRAVLLRPLSEEEFGASQVQAIDAEMIAHQLLAAAFVVPVVTEQDVPALPIELLRFLQEAVNRISGFAVFSDVADPMPQR